MNTVSYTGMSGEVLNIRKNNGLQFLILCFRSSSKLKIKNAISATGLYTQTEHLVETVEMPVA